MNRCNPPSAACGSIGVPCGSVKVPCESVNTSQADLAKWVDVSVTYISLIETAKKQANLDSLVRIADILGVTINHLLSGNQASIR